ncbi:MAG: PCMD domain-containing protein [Bacteroidales bacterium]|nr:PCMD domain-containing protein [Bacteroidales bacterium]
MRKTVILLAAVFTAFSCSQKWNDLVHEEVPAEVLAFELEGQTSVRISKATKVVTASFPKGTEFNALTVNTFKVTDGASCSRVIKAGDVLDLTDTLKLTLTTYDDYLWKIVAEEEKPVEPQPKDGPQLYNMLFDRWSTENRLPVPYDADATDQEKAVWGNADQMLALLGFPTMRNETEFLAVKGEGKAALRLETQGIAQLKKLAAGSLFTGKLHQLDIFSQTAELKWGVPFTARPAALEGYVCSQPKPIDYAEGAQADKKGQLDKASVTVILTDWEEQFLVNPPSKLVDVDNDPHIIGYGKMTFEKEMTQYEKFHLDIAYRNDRTPTMVTIVTSSSYLGDFFTGGSGSVVYFDEFQFIYY